MTPTNNQTTAPSTFHSKSKSKSNKMVYPAKQMLSAGASNVIGEHRKHKNEVGIGKFRVYSVKEKPKIDTSGDSSRKSVPVYSGINQTGRSNAKGGQENMEKGKVTSDNYVGGIARRKALADLSNVQSMPPSKAVCDGSKPMKYKSERIKTVPRVPAILSSRPAVAPKRKSLLNQKQARAGENPSQGTSGPSTSRAKEGRSTIEENRAVVRLSAQCPVISSRRMNKINSCTMARKSLPILTHDVQGNCECSDKQKRKVAVPVKREGVKQLQPRITNSQSLIARKRVSDGCLLKASKGQNFAGASELARKSTVPVGRKSPHLNVRRTLQSKQETGSDKLSSTSTVSSENQRSVAVPLQENTSSVGFQEDRTKNVSSGNAGSGEDAFEIISKRKPERRKSYTSLLITAKSKFVSEQWKFESGEGEPSIDDGSNQLEVAEYVDEIYQYYWATEALTPSLANYMSMQTEITHHMRGILINWLLEVHFKFDLMHETLFLMVTLLDSYLSQVTIQKNEMQLVGLVALLLASKYEDFWHPRIKDLISISAESYTREQMLRMEKSILKQLKFRLNMPTPYVFMLRFLKAARSDKKLEHLAFYLIELCLVEQVALHFKPSLLCASAIYVARSTLQITPVWSPLLGRHARCEVVQIRECAEMILRFHQNAGSGRLKVTYEKYSGPRFSSVAAIKPLEKLPL